MRRTVVIDRRFRGPPGSANGGYVGGLVAEVMRGSGEVTLRRPPPLETALTLERLEGGRVELRDGETLVAEGRRPSASRSTRPTPVGLDEARAGAEASPWRDRHPFPECFGCGPARSPSDGLRILPGAAARAPGGCYGDALGSRSRLRGRRRRRRGARGLGGAGLRERRGARRRPRSVGARAPRRRAAPAACEAGEPYIVILAWSGEGEGRKQQTGVGGLDAADGQLVGIARALWIELTADQAAAATGTPRAASPPRSRA